MKRILNPVLTEDVASTTRFWAPTSKGDINLYATYLVLVNSGELSCASRQSVISHVAVKCSGNPITVVCTSYGGVVTVVDGVESWRPSSFRAWKEVLELSPEAGPLYLKKSAGILGLETDPEIRANVFAQQAIVRAAMQTLGSGAEDLGRCRPQRRDP